MPRYFEVQSIIYVIPNTTFESFISVYRDSRILVIAFSISALLYGSLMLSGNFFQKGWLNNDFYSIIIYRYIDLNFISINGRFLFEKK